MSGWTKAEIIALFSVVVALLGVAANVSAPQLRCSLFKDCPAPPPPVPLSSGFNNFNNTPLISTVTGVDYSPLGQLLATEQWKEADELTWKLMLKAAKREQKGYFDSKSLKNFSCSDLKTIDQLWVKYSQGKFGFSVQKQLYLSVGGKLGSDNWTDQDSYNYRRYLIMVGWKTGTPNNSEGLINYDDLTFNLFAPKDTSPI